MSEGGWEWGTCVSVEGGVGVGVLCECEGGGRGTCVSEVGGGLV